MGWTKTFFFMYIKDPWWWDLSACLQTHSSNIKAEEIVVSEILVND